MQARTRRRRPPAPGYRNPALPRHPTGRARRRWPRAYDGGTPEAQVRRRYRRELDRDLGTGAGRHTRRRSGMDRLRQSPVRNGLVGLAVVGAAAPLAVNRYQTALRTDATHERIATTATGDSRMSDDSVSAVWQELEAAQNSEEAARDEVIRESMERYADYNLSRDLAERIYDRAVEAEVDPEIAFGLVRAESSFRNQSTSVVGAVGLTQLMPRTASWLEPGVTRSQLRDPDTNLRIGLKYLKQLTDKYKGDVDLALVAYNRGPGTVDRALKRGQNPDNGYSAFVKGEANHGHKLFTR